MTKFFANFFWIHLPSKLQGLVSYFYSKIFHTRISKLIIIPYCLFFGINSDYLDQFQTERETSEYTSYSDFFRRKYKMGPILEADKVWPCEGYICDWGPFSETRSSVVKGTRIDLNKIFQTQPEDTKNHFFVNVFLHNHNYHRIHSPCELKVEEILNIPGHLNFLRPWFYKRENVSYPAVQNERTIIRFSDKNLNNWYMAIVGGFAVGTILLENNIKPGVILSTGQEIAHFNMGSTLCLALPEKINVEKYLQEVRVGQSLNFFEKEFSNGRINRNNFRTNFKASREIT